MLIPVDSRPILLDCLSASPILELAVGWGCFRSGGGRASLPTSLKDMFEMSEGRFPVSEHSRLSNCD